MRIRTGGPVGMRIGGPGGSSPAERSEADQTAALPWPKRSAKGGALRGTNK